MIDDVFPVNVINNMVRVVIGHDVAVCIRHHGSILQFIYLGDFRLFPGIGIYHRIYSQRFFFFSLQSLAGCGVMTKRNRILADGVAVFAKGLCILPIGSRIGTAGLRSLSQCPSHVSGSNGQFTGCEGASA